MVQKKGDQAIIGQTGAAALAIIGFAGSLIFLGSNITGNAIGGSEIANWLGAIFFVLGICGALGFFKHKRKDKAVSKPVRRKRTRKRR